MTTQKYFLRKIIAFLHSLKTGERPFSRTLFSQGGEDIVLSWIFRNQSIDVGAHHPFKGSNTYELYKNGWSGVIIDPLPNTKKLFNTHRKRDIALEIAIGRKKKKATYFQFAEPLVNTLDPTAAQELIEKGDIPLIRKTNIEVTPLKNICATHLARKKLDLLCVDAEGFDLQILKTHDWKKWRPSVVVVEVPTKHDCADIQKSEIGMYLTKKKYRLYSRVWGSAIFIDPDLTLL
jgi:FkbM family methyltransferase